MKKYLWRMVWLLFPMTILGCQDRTPAEIDLISFRMSPTGFLVAPREDVPLEIIFKNKEGDVLNVDAVTYSSSQPGIIEVSPKGDLSCKKFGDADIKIVAGPLKKAIFVHCVDSRFVEIWGQVTADVPLEKHSKRYSDVIHDPIPENSGTESADIR